MKVEEKKELLEFLARHTTLVLATVGKEGIPAAAALFYAEDDSLNLYFISDAESEHSRNIDAGSRVGLVIAADSQDWKELNGVQMKGTCARVTSGDRAIARQRYLSKFPFVLQSSMLRKRIEQSEFYIIRPEWIRFSDNRRGFAENREWVLTRIFHRARNGNRVERRFVTGFGHFDREKPALQRAAVKYPG